MPKGLIELVVPVVDHSQQSVLHTEGPFGILTQRKVTNLWGPAREISPIEQLDPIGRLGLGCRILRPERSGCRGDDSTGDSHPMSARNKIHVKAPEVFRVQDARRRLHDGFSLRMVS
jgi:hypothetical protein